MYILRMLTWMAQKHKKNRPHVAVVGQSQTNAGVARTTLRREVIVVVVIVVVVVIFVVIVIVVVGGGGAPQSRRASRNAGCAVAVHRETTVAAQDEVGVVGKKKR